ncbi:MAG: hypothetical protein HY425_01510 [Candidatus Levybacteria bacterium]|nr:hypothetical protein [Candidatus Levybacteria bacterium]
MLNLFQHLAPFFWSEIPKQVRNDIDWFPNFTLLPFTCQWRFGKIKIVLCHAELVSASHSIERQSACGQEIPK